MRKYLDLKGVLDCRRLGIATAFHANNLDRRITYACCSDPLCSIVISLWWPNRECGTRGINYLEEKLAYGLACLILIKFSKRFIPTSRVHKE
jgi:hypothetical protein